MVHYSKDGFLLCNGCANDHRRAEGDDQVSRADMHYGDNQVDCAGCGLQVHPMTGEHIEEFIG